MRNLELTNLERAQIELSYALSLINILEKLYRTNHNAAEKMLHRDMQTLQTAIKKALALIEAEGGRMMRYLVVGYDYFFYPYFQSYFDNYEEAERTARFLMQSKDVLAVKIAKNAKVKKWEKK